MPFWNGFQLTVRGYATLMHQLEDEARLEKVNNRPGPAEPAAPGGAFHSTDRLETETRPRDPTNHADRRRIETNILARRPRRSGARARSDEPVNARGAVSPVEAALSAAPDPLGPSHEQTARAAFPKSSHPAWLAFGAVRMVKSLESSDGAEALYEVGEPGTSRALFHRSADGALTHWRAGQPPARGGTWRPARTANALDSATRADFWSR